MRRDWIGTTTCAGRRLRSEPGNAVQVLLRALARTHRRYWNKNGPVESMNVTGKQVRLLALVAIIAILVACPPSAIYTVLQQEERDNGLGGSGAWGALGSPDFSGGAIGPISIASGPNGTASVVYHDWGAGPKATGMQFNGSSWVVMGSPGFSAAGISTPSVAYDSTGKVYVVYQDGVGGPPNYATVMQFNGVSWAAVGTPRFTPGNATDTSLALDSTNAPYVAFCDGASGSRASVMKYSGSWGAVGALDFSAGAAFSTSLAIDSSNTLYVAFGDTTQGN